jgi:hypothetical protein
MFCVPAASWPRPRRTEARPRRLRAVEKLLKDGKTQAETGAIVGVSQKQVSDFLDKLLNDREAATADLNTTASSTRRRRPTSPAPRPSIAAKAQEPIYFIRTE